jgi:hypothetical protein
MTNDSIQLRDLVIHKQIEIVGMVVFVDPKKRELRVRLDEDLPLETWSFTEVDLFQKGSSL